jgi:hypothetical protein
MYSLLIVMVFAVIPLPFFLAATPLILIFACVGAYIQSQPEDPVARKGMVGGLLILIAVAYFGGQLFTSRTWIWISVVIGGLSTVLLPILYTTIDPVPPLVQPETVLPAIIFILACVLGGRQTFTRLK